VLCDAGSDSTSGEAGNVEPSAQFSDGDASNRLFCRRCAAYAQVTNLEAARALPRSSPAPATPATRVPAGCSRTVPASSLPGYLRQHYTTSSDHGLGARLLPGLEWRHRHALPGQGSAEDRSGERRQARKRRKPEGKPESARTGLAGQPKSGDARAGGVPGRTPMASRAARARAPGRRLGKRWHGRVSPPDGTKPADGQGAPRRPRPTARWAHKQKLAGRGKPDIEEPPKSDDAAREESAKHETAR